MPSRKDIKCKYCDTMLTKRNKKGVCRKCGIGRFHLRKRTPEENMLSSNRLKEQWLSGVRVMGKKENHPAWKEELHNKICIACGAKYSSKRISSEFCSSKCYGKKISGRGSRLWKEEKSTELIDQVRNCTKYSEWRQSIFIRDDFKCKNCGQHGGDLNCHHIKLLSDLVKEATLYIPLISEYDACILYTPIWDVSNGITYCKECHKYIHKITRREYGLLDTIKFKSISLR